MRCGGGAASARAVKGRSQSPARGTIAPGQRSTRRAVAVAPNRMHSKDVHLGIAAPLSSQLSKIVQVVAGSAAPLAQSLQHIVPAETAVCRKVKRCLRAAAAALNFRLAAASCTNAAELSARCSICEDSPVVGRKRR